MPATKEWTLMFYFASDNPLAISIVSQLKALKAAGYHPEVNVVAQFDPYTEGTPTHIFDVNYLNKKKNPGEADIGFAGTDSFVRNLLEDKLWRNERDRENQFIRTTMKEILGEKGITYDAPQAPKIKDDDDEPSAPRVNRHHRSNEPAPKKCLDTFLSFCAEKYPARHYMLFIVGHGVVVGNDIFLLDEHAETQSITLNEMGAVLREFKAKIVQDGGNFDLIGFHSCSVSSLEVAYELRNTARYMLASQAPTFVGSWPYRQILIRIFKDIRPDGRNRDIDELLSDIFHYCLHNSVDFLLAGYSYQLTLCDLRRIPNLERPVEKLTKALVNGLGHASSRYVILFSHWKAQSFYQEMYTDLYDFCFCIKERCNRIRQGRGELSRQLKALERASDQVMEVLKAPNRENGEGHREPPTGSFIVAQKSAGPAYQYSRGVSVYFPWTRPSEDSQILQQYRSYRFNLSFQGESWLKFLNAYFQSTLREASRTEQDRENGNTRKETPEEILREDIGSLIYGGEGPLGSSLSKTDPRDRTGGNCDCPSFKNYPHDTRARRERRKKAVPPPAPVTLFGKF